MIVYVVISRHNFLIDSESAKEAEGRAGNNAIKDKLAFENEHKIFRTGPCSSGLQRLKKTLIEVNELVKNNNYFSFTRHSRNQLYRDPLILKLLGSI